MTETLPLEPSLWIASLRGVPFFFRTGERPDSVVSQQMDSVLVRKLHCAHHLHSTKWKKVSLSVSTEKKLARTFQIAPPAKSYVTEATPNWCFSRALRKLIYDVLVQWLSQLQPLEELLTLGVSNTCGGSKNQVLFMSKSGTMGPQASLWPLEGLQCAEWVWQPAIEE